MMLSDELSPIARVVLRADNDLGHVFFELIIADADFSSPRWSAS